MALFHAAYLRGEGPIKSTGFVKHAAHDRKSASQSESIREHPIPDIKPSNIKGLSSCSNRHCPLPSEPKAGIVAGIKSDTRCHAPYQ
jgi:hypothetical protein